MTGMYDGDEDDFIPGRRSGSTKTTAGGLADDGVVMNTPTPKAGFKGSTYRVFFWIFSVTFVLIVATLLFAYLYVLLNPENKDLPTTDAFVTVLKVIANILLGLVGGE